MTLSEDYGGTIARTSVSTVDAASRCKQSDMNLRYSPALGVRCIRESPRSNPATLEEAVNLLRNVPAGVDRRFYALRNGFEPHEVPEHGIGLFVVEVATGRVCEFRGQWVDEGRFLLCENCFEDGT
jgi:hypothetical protein